MISGANGSGKSGQHAASSPPGTKGNLVYLKQVALIVFLTHIGSYVPAEEAIIGPTDRIFARIYSRYITLVCSQKTFNTTVFLEKLYQYRAQASWLVGDTARTYADQ